MGCHTWFYNKVSEMPNSHLASLKEEALRSISLHVDYPTFEDWCRSEREFAKDCLDNMKLCQKNKDVTGYSMWKRAYHKSMNPRKCEWKSWVYRKKYVLRKLKSRNIGRHELLGILKKEEPYWFIHSRYPQRPGLYYDRVPGYSDNFRIFDYDAEPWFSYDDFINYLNTHPEIKVTGNRWSKELNSMEPMEIGEAKHCVKQFFKQYPNGYISLG